MSEKIGPLATEGKHRCNNCLKVWPAKKLEAIHDLFQRAEPGDYMPSGECPECGALCFPFKRPSRAAIERDNLEQPPPLLSPGA